MECRVFLGREIGLVGCNSWLGVCVGELVAQGEAELECTELESAF